MKMACKTQPYHLRKSNYWLDRRIQKKVVKVEIHFCPTCTYSKATRKPWKGKGTSKPLKEMEYPGQCVSV